MGKKIVGLIGILFVLGTYRVWAAEIEVGSSIDKRQVQIDEEVSFTIRILGAGGNVPAPRLPVFQGFDSYYTGRTSQFTFVNGKSSATVEFNYVLVPKVAGRFTLDGVEVWIEGKRYQTQPLEVEVIGPRIQPVGTSGASQPSQLVATRSPQIPPQALPLVRQPGGPPPMLVEDDNIFVKASVDKQTVYPNEQILLTYSLYTRYDTRYEGFEEEPSVSGFWIEDFPLDREGARDTISMHGKRYVKADIRKIALFPTAPAPYTIQPGTLKVSIREQPKTSSLFDEFFDDSFFSGASFFSRRVDRLLKPEPLSITVRPFPETGKPASFNGAVGHFVLNASVDKKEINQNEPVTLKLVLEGEGNIETLSRPPVPPLTGFKVYDGDSSTQLFKQGPSLAGKKEFEIIFIPTEAGELSIPPLEFSYFDPRQETYQVLWSQAFPLQVKPSNEPLRLPAELAQKEAFKKEIRLETKDIRYIHEEFTSRIPPRIQMFLYYTLAGLNLVGLVFVANGLLRQRREALFSRDEALRRKMLARTIALRRMKIVNRLAKSQKPEEAEQFLREAEKALSEYVCNKFNVSAYQFTKEWLEEKLRETLGADDPLPKQIRELYNQASETRYGRGVLPIQERRQFLELIEMVIRRIERLR